MVHISEKIEKTPLNKRKSLFDVQNLGYVTAEELEIAKHQCIEAKQIINRAKEEAESVKGLPKYEYKVIFFSCFGKDFTEGNEKMLNELGSKGWECVNFLTDPYKMDGSFYKAILKREKIT